MYWAPINLKLRHLFRIVLTYIAYESNISIIVNYLNYVIYITFFVLVSILL